MRSLKIKQNGCLYSTWFEFKNTCIDVTSFGRIEKYFQFHGLHDERTANIKYSTHYWVCMPHQITSFGVVDVRESLSSHFGLTMAALGSAKHVRGDSSRSWKSYYFTFLCTASLCYIHTLWRFFRR